MIFSPKKTGIAAFCSSLLLAVLSLSAYGEDIKLQPRSHDGSLVRVKTIVEVAGSLIVDPNRNASADEQPKFPMKVNAEMLFDERGLPNDNDSIRHYWKANVKIDVNESTDDRSLREDRNLIRLTGNETGNRRITSAHGLLSRAELELLDVPGNVFPPENLLTDEAISKASTWKHDKQTIAEILRLEEITSGEVISEVTEITDSVVKISLKGNVEGKVDGVETSMEIVGNYHFDRESQFVKWLAIAIRENREVGFGTPGIEVTSRIRSARQIIPASQPLSNEVIAELVRAQPEDNPQPLEFTASDSFYRMAIDRNWYVLSTRGSSATLRMIDDGDLLATCKIDQLNKSVPGKHVTLDGFRDDVQAALAKNCKEVLSVGQTVSPNNIRVLKVVAAGEVGDTPIQWIYYHLSDDNGNRLSCIFTLEASFQDRFAGMDESLTNSIEFVAKWEANDEPDEEDEAEQQAQATGSALR